MLNIDHGVLNPRSLIEIEKQSQVGDSRKGGGEVVNPFSQKLEHSTIEGQHSQYRGISKGIDLSTREALSRTCRQAFPSLQTCGGADNEPKVLS